MRQIPLDALPDLSNTQVIVYSQWDRSPDLIEDQVTYPIVTAMLGVPKVKAVRAVSDFGSSFVYVIFEDGTDLYWARSRTRNTLLEFFLPCRRGSTHESRPGCHRPRLDLSICLDRRLAKICLRHNSARHRTSFFAISCARFRESRRSLRLGGFVMQYQVTVDAARLRAMGLPFTAVVDAVRHSNVETGGRLMEFGGTEYMIRGRGYVQSPRDLEEAVVTGGETIADRPREGRRQGHTRPGDAARYGRPGRARRDRLGNRRDAAGGERR